MTTWCVGGRAAPPRGGVSGSMSAASSGSEKKRGTVLLTVAQTTTWCERRAVLSKTFHTLCSVTLCPHCEAFFSLLCLFGFTPFMAKFAVFSLNDSISIFRWHDTCDIS